MVAYPFTTNLTFQRTIVPSPSRLCLNTNFPSIMEQPSAVAFGTSLNTPSSRMDLSLSLQAASHFGVSGDAIASVKVQGSSEYGVPVSESPFIPVTIELFQNRSRLRL